MRQGALSGERGHGAQRSPAVTLHASDRTQDQHERGRAAKAGLSALRSTKSTPNIGNVVVSASVAGSGPPPCASVYPASTPTTQYLAVVERSTTPANPSNVAFADSIPAPCGHWRLGFISLLRGAAPQHPASARLRPSPFMKCLHLGSAAQSLLAGLELINCT
jgi:hypothetical protein